MVYLIKKLISAKTWFYLLTARIVLREMKPGWWSWGQVFLSITPKRKWLMRDCCWVTSSPERQAHDVMLLLMNVFKIMSGGKHYFYKCLEGTKYTQLQTGRKESCDCSCVSWWYEDAWIADFRLLVIYLLAQYHSGPLCGRSEKQAI